MKKILTTIWLVISISLYAAAQETLTLSGTVFEDSGQPAIGASVFVKGTDNGTVTDVMGFFNIQTRESRVTLVISYMGFMEKEVEVSGGQKDLRVVLEPDLLTLDDVIVVGYGESTRKKITSSVAKLDADAIKDIPITTLGEGLKGKVAGLRVTQTDFSPGGGFTYSIRGGSSINGSNSPLILVDGVERDFSTLNPNDIASIEVLKDAASSAIYGAKSSNGIILVTTKKGGYNSAPRVTFEANLAYQNTETEIDFLGAEDYIRTVRTAVAEYLDVPDRAGAARSYLDGATSAGTGNKPGGKFSTRYFDPATETLPEGYQTMTDPLDPTKTIMFKDTDWQDLMYNPALWQNYYIGLDGGSQNVRYSASVGYMNDQGVAVSTGYDRFNVKSSIEAKVWKKLTVNVGFDFARSNTEAYENQRNTISRGLANPPTMNAWYDDGTPVEGYNSTSQTPLFYKEYYDRSNVQNRLTINGGLKWEILPGLNANVTGSFYNRRNIAKQFIRENVFDATRRSSQSQNFYDRRKAEAFISYDKTFASAHHLGVMAGYSYQSYIYETFSAVTEGGTSDKVTTMNGGSVFVDATSTRQKTVEMGFFGRLNYDYKGRYLLTATFREDASSKFARQSRWGFFPGISAGWVMSEENWLKDNRVLNFLKIRASYGSTGNNASVGIYDAYGSYTAGYIYNGHSGIKPTDMPNENLQWETSDQLDLGLEFSLLKNRIYVSADYFDKRTRNLLYEQKLPNTTGFSKVWTNLGKVRFWGYELELTTHNIVRKNFNWDSKLVLSYQQNRVLSLPDNGIAKNRTGGIPLGDGTYFGGVAEGEPLYRFYGYVATGILETEEQAANAYYDALSRLPEKGKKRVGDYEWADRNGDGQITDSDLYCLGVTVPPFTGGFSNTFRYKNLSLDIYLDWATGHSIFDESYQRYFYGTYTNNYALASDVLKAWKKPGDKTKYAKFNANDSAWGNDNYNRRPSNVFTYKGDYLCLREVTLQYRLDEKLLKKSRINSITFTLSGNNLYYFTQVKGISPEMGSSSSYDGSYNNYPPVRRVSFGVRLTF